MLVGDECIDHYQYGVVERLSPEAPVPLFKTTRTDTKAGMAGNVHNNLLRLGCDVVYFHCQQRCTRTRLIDERSGQHIVRIDHDVVSNPLGFDYYDFDREHFDVVVISDYDRGAVGESTVRSIVSHFEGPIFADTKKKDHSIFSGCYLKVNEAEYLAATNRIPSTIITHGKRGATLGAQQFPGYEVGVADITGAGDTFLAALAYKYGVSGSLVQAIEFANKASSIAVQHVGVYAPTLEEIEGR